MLQSSTKERDPARATRTGGPSLEGVSRGAVRPGGAAGEDAGCSGARTEMEARPGRRRRGECGEAGRESRGQRTNARTA